MKTEVVTGATCSIIDVHTYKHRLDSLVKLAASNANITTYDTNSVKPLGIFEAIVS